MKLFVISLLWLSSICLYSQTTLNLQQPNPDQVLQSIQKISVGAIENNGVVTFKTDANTFYNSLTPDYKGNKEVTAEELASLALYAIKALSDKSLQFQESKRMLDEASLQLSNELEKVQLLELQINKLEKKILELENQQLEMQYKNEKPKSK